MIIQLDHIEKTYGSGANKVPVLHDVNMQVEEGEHFLLTKEELQRLRETVREFTESFQ